MLDPETRTLFNRKMLKVLCDVMKNAKVGVTVLRLPTLPRKMGIVFCLKGVIIHISMTLSVQNAI